MSGIYIHIPFCKKKCHYCDFYSISNYGDSVLENYILALVKEIDIRKSEILYSKPKTIFIGGGTPNVLPLELLNKLLSFLDKTFNLSTIEEYTIESNPEFINNDKLNLFNDKGINRISIGIQSLNDNLLSILGRLANRKRNLSAIELAKNSPITRINFDMIFGIPSQTIDNLYEDISTIMSFNPSHISYYGLTVEEDTKLYDMIMQKTLAMPDDSTYAKMYLLIIDELKKYGLDLYEISNFARIGQQSKHNMNYWNRGLYYGFGASAVSFDGIRRYKNHTSVEKYINAIQKDETYIEESEILTKEQEIIEYIMLALRTTNGLNLEWLANKYGIDLLSIDNNKLLLILNDKKLIKLMNGRLSITPEGFLLYNSIVGDIISAIN